MLGGAFVEDCGVPTNILNINKPFMPTNIAIR
jgi:hypothetical protein